MTLTLTAQEQSDIASCSDTMLHPLDYPTLDAWRAAVLSAFSGVINTDAAFFNFRTPPNGTRTAFSLEISGALLDQYEHLCVNDAGFERATEMRLTALNQTMLVAGDWDAYHADPFVSGFYLPNKLLDSAAMILLDPSSGLGASIELHSSRIGTRDFGPRGVAILRLLLPSFRAGIAAVNRSHVAHGQMAALLNASTSALRAFDAGGRCLHQTPRVDALLRDEPQRSEVLACMTQLARQASASSGPAKARDERVTCPCTTELQTALASYRIEATRVSAFPNYGRVILVALERLSPTPLADAVLLSRYRLSRREIGIAREIARGASSMEIATALVISVHTVKRHTEQVFAKLGVHTRSAVAAALLS